MSKCKLQPRFLPRSFSLAPPPSCLTSHPPRPSSHTCHTFPLLSLPSSLTPYPTPLLPNPSFSPTPSCLISHFPHRPPSPLTPPHKPPHSPLLSHSSNLVPTLLSLTLLPHSSSLLPTPLSLTPLPHPSSLTPPPSTLLPSSPPSLFISPTYPLIPFPRPFYLLPNC